MSSGSCLRGDREADPLHVLAHAWPAKYELAPVERVCSRFVPVAAGSFAQLPVHLVQRIPQTGVKGVVRSAVRKVHNSKCALTGNEGVTVACGSGAQDRSRAALGEAQVCGHWTVGRTTYMARSELLEQIRVATAPNEIPTASADARAWLAWLRDHPRDHQAFFMVDLLSVDRRARVSASQSGRK